MTRSKSFRVALMIAAALAASGCGVFKKGKKTNTPVLGQRVAVLTTERRRHRRPGHRRASDESAGSCRQ